MLDIESVDSNTNAETTSSAEKPTRRRRAASRAAGPPPEAAVVADVPQTTVATPSDDAPAEAPAEPAPTRRRAASRPAGSPEPVKAPDPIQAVVEPEPAVEFPDTAQADAPDAVQADAPEAQEEAPTKPARRRSRSRKSEAKKTPVEPEETPQQEPMDGIAAALQRAEAEAAERLGLETQPTLDEADEAEEVPAEAPVEEDTDEIAVALRAAEEAAAARKELVADPFALNSDSRQAELAKLAGAIAGDDEDDESDDDSDEDDDDEADDSDDSDDAEDGDDDSDDEDNADGDQEQRPQRRRRRRGGRRRRRGGQGGDDGSESEDSEKNDENDDSDDSEESTDSDDNESDDNGAGGDDDGGSNRRRRRRRRRRSGDDSGSAGTGDDEITGIDGSTRMEAKRQRRKENRAAGRRRAPILSEAEFLARRESVDRKMVIRQKDDYTQLAVLEDGILVEHYVDRASSTSLIGNVYLGKVQNVLPSMEAAFIDIGRGRNAVLYAGEVDWDNFGVTAENRKVENVFKSGQSVLVQVTKDPVGAKGARLTGHISLPGRYIVYSPGGHLSGISRKLPDSERARLREILGELITESESVIVRTAAEGVSSDELVRDVNRLKAQWEVIEKKVKQGKAPQALHSEPDLTLRIVRDLFTEDFRKLVVQGNGGQDDAWDSISAYVSHVAPHLVEHLEQYEMPENGDDVFAKYRVDEQIAKALDRKVYLPSGGSLVIDRTEAMTVIDVNTGRFTGSGGNLEATVTSNNLEAAEEIVRQLRLRDIGGIIVIDFIDMVLPSNRDLLLRRLVECLARDRTRHQVAEVTSLGLVQLTRKKIGTGLAEAFTEECECCNGSGYHRSDEPVESQSPADGGDRRQGNGNGRRRRRGNNN